MTKQSMDRRSFLKFCGAIAATLGLEASFVPRIAQALTTGTKPPVVWLHFAECTGCSEAFLRASNPSVSDLIFNTIDLEYHETLMASAGVDAEDLRDNVVLQYPKQFICIVEGAIPTAANGVYGMIGSQTMLQIAQSIIPQAQYVICYGTCASFGGLPAAAPNPTGAKGVKDALGVSTINLSGCPPHPMNLISTLTSYLLNGTMPALDANGRPTFAYGKTVHSQCPKPYGCLQGYNCKGQTAYNNCPTQKFNDGESYCIQVEHPCIGCSEPGFWDVNAPFYNPMWASMFATYRLNAAAHPVNPAASCTPCHSSSQYSTYRSRDGLGMALTEHNRHNVNVSTNTACGNCHSAPGGTTTSGK